MSEKPAPKAAEAHPEPSEQERGRQEAGQREQGVRSERSADTSGPQVTTPADEPRGTPERGAKG
ncbi:MAG: hypothetical protein QOH00_3807 [Gaiellales bacterium]|jgi:hypothetical protein|nr:hypothetical protein [Gaiellales bacterium]